MKDRVNIVNKKAKFEYEFIDSYEAGLMLFGPEVKSIRNGSLSFVDSYCLFINGELYMRNVSITYNSSDEYKRDRKILLNKRELIKIQKELDKGLTIVPYRVYTNERDRLKVEIVICRGKKLYDKRDTIKKRDIEREVKRNLK